MTFDQKVFAVLTQQTTDSWHCQHLLRKDHELLAGTEAVDTMMSSSHDRAAFKQQISSAYGTVPIVDDQVLRTF